MYRFFVNPDDITEETITITGSDVNHIKNVIRLKVGDDILISNGVDKDYHCKITSLNEDNIAADILDIDGAKTELPARIYIFQGLPKGDKMELVIQKAVELGAYEIIPVSTKRVIVRLDKKKGEAKIKRWNAISESAAKQSKRVIIPKVTGVKTFTDAVEYAKDFELVMIPYEEAVNIEETKQVLGRAKPGQRIGIFIGPEGGFCESEIELAIQNKIIPITLGKRILRTETVGLMVLSILMFQLEH